MEKRLLKKGEKLYKFEINGSDGKFTVRELFVKVDQSPSILTVCAGTTYKGKKRTEWIDARMICWDNYVRVTNRSRSYFVTMPEYDPERAKKIVKDLYEDRIDELTNKANALRGYLESVKDMGDPRLEK